MNAAELLRRLARALALVVLASSGWFMVVYLLRWEWNRALICGIVFLAAEIFLVADLLARRAAVLDHRIQQGHESGREQAEALAAVLRRSRRQGPGPFAWLRQTGGADQDRTFVLVPILLSAGVILSGIAYLVERLSRVTAAPVAEHELARGLSGMSLPASGLLPTGEVPASAVDRPPPAPHERHDAAVIGITAAVLLAIILALVSALLTRPAPPDPGSALAVDLMVSTNRLDQQESAVAASLWAMCRLRLPSQVALLSMAPSPDDPAVHRLVVSPAPARFDEREFLGCLQDTIVDRALARVVVTDVVAR